MTPRRPATLLWHANSKLWGCGESSRPAGMLSPLRSRSSWKRFWSSWASSLLLHGRMEWQAACWRRAGSALQGFRCLRDTPGDLDHEFGAAVVAILVGGDVQADGHLAAVGAQQVHHLAAAAAAGWHLALCQLLRGSRRELPIAPSALGGGGGGGQPRVGQRPHLEPLPVELCVGWGQEAAQVHL